FSRFLLLPNSVPSLSLLLILSLGLCKSGAKCQYRHDKERIAVCRDWLTTGTCSKPATCPLRHEPSAHLIPHCKHFDKSICTREDCPYTHVHVSKGAKICEDFIQGFCEQGEECEMKHLWGRKAQVEMIWQRSEEEKREMNEEVRRKVHEGVEKKKKSRDKSKNKKAGKKEKSKQKNENKRGREEESFSNQKGKRVRIDMMSIDNTSDSSSGE